MHGGSSLAAYHDQVVIFISIGADWRQLHVLQCYRGFHRVRLTVFFVSYSHCAVTCRVLDHSCAICVAACLRRAVREASRSCRCVRAGSEIRTQYIACCACCVYHQMHLRALQGGSTAAHNAAVTRKANL